MYKRLIAGKKAVLFDLDGTIVDTAKYWSEAVNRVLVKLGVDWASAANRYIPGDDLVAQWERLRKSYTFKTDKTTKQLAEETNTEFLEVIKDAPLEEREGFYSFVYELKFEKNIKVALLTNSSKEAATAILKKIEGEKVFDLIIFGDEVSKPKPDPEIYKKALEKLRIKANEAIVFEDSPTGAKAASLADLEMAIILDDYYFAEEQFTGKIFVFLPNFEPLPNHLDYTYKEYLDFHINRFNEQQKKRKEMKASDIGK